MLVTPDDYLAIREWLDVDAEDVSDTKINAYARQAEATIRRRVTDYDTATGSRLEDLHQAAIMLTASLLTSIIASGGETVTQIKVGDSSATMTARNWDDLGRALDALAWGLIIVDVVPTTRSASHFGVVKTAGACRRW